ncbi:MAG: transcription elongation factor GreA [Bdellovibrionales bacterium RBG_16_40_8]|nr:MAG: transcription elongation factor GreA [Bdellovibrionales bacterium RBG_16_40_8]
MSGQERQPMTSEGKTKLENELRHLMHTERPQIIKAIEEARSNGDITENADYDAAKERQAFCESRISDIQVKIANAEVIDTKSLKSEKVIFGAFVILQDVESNDEVTYQIVGEDESDVKSGKISVFSPLARAVIGKKKGDSVELKSPKGEKEYEIKNFFFR